MSNEFHTGERLYLGHTIKEVAKEHIARYKFAQAYINENAICLDIACGSGYGSELLSQRAKKVIGVDINHNALLYARDYHQHPNIEFRFGDLNQSLDFPDNYFDLIVSFETLEHIENQENALAEFNRILKTNGLLIISTPDRNIMSQGGKVENEFHVRELSQSEFVELMNRYFKVREYFGQNRFKPSVAGQMLKRIRSLRKYVWLRNSKRVLLKILHLKNFMHKRIVGAFKIDIVPINIQEKNEDFYVLLGVAEKK